MKRKRITFILLCCQILFFQYTISAQSSSSDPLVCIKEAGTRFSAACKTYHYKPTKEYCGQKYSGEHKLSDASKSLIAEYCLEKGDKVTYRNRQGKTTEFTMVGKSFSYTYGSMDTGFPCPDNDDKTYKCCSDVQTLIVTLESEPADLVFQINLSPLVICNSEKEFGHSGDHLSIQRFAHSAGYKGLRAIDFSAIVDPGTLNSPSVSGQTFYYDIKLLGTVYENVYSNDWTNSPASHRNMYYSNLGLIAYEDESGSIWVRD